MPQRVSDDSKRTDQANRDRPWTPDQVVDTVYRLRGRKGERQRRARAARRQRRHRSRQRRRDPLRKYLRLGVLAEQQLYKLFDWDRPFLKDRQRAIARSLKAPLLGELREWGSKRSSEAMVEAGDILKAYASGREEVPALQSVIGLLDRLAQSKPKLLRSVVWPALLALQHARAGDDREVADRLEGLFLRLVRKAPAVVVSGVVNVGNPRFRGAAKKGKHRWRIAAIRRSVASATVTFRTVLLDPLRERLNREGDASTLQTLSGIESALDAVVLALRTHRGRDGTARVSRRPSGIGGRPKNASREAVPQPGSAPIDASSRAPDTETGSP